MFDTMKFSSLLANAAAVLEMASLAMAQEKCGSEEPGAEAYQAAVSLRAVQRAEGLSAYVLAKRAKGLLIMTYLHVVEDEAHRGFVTDKMIDDQMRVLNATFAPHNIQFVVRNVTHTVNDAWTVQARIKEKAEALRQGRLRRPQHILRDRVHEAQLRDRPVQLSSRRPLEYGHQRHVVVRI
ncbi:metalloprotease 1 [Colletotrichum graminicola]|nr:metalloprotease 1 [Colletotrichum graminicola]